MTHGSTMSAREAETQASAYFARQYGVITVQQAHRAGLSDRMIEYRVSTGRWTRLATGLYAVVSAPPNWQRDLAAAVLLHPTVFVAGRSAAALHGFPGIRHRQPEVMVPLTSNARSPLAKVHRSAFFHQIGTTRVAGFEVTTPAETVLTLAARFPAQRIEGLVDETIIKRSATLDEYEQILDRIAGGRVRGSALMRRIVTERRPDAYQPPSSQLERLSRRLTGQPGIPPVSHQHPVLGTAGPMIVDTFIDDWLIVVEVDGRNYHTRKLDFERDRRRDNAAAALGYVTLRFTWRMVTDDFDYCLQTLLETGKRRQDLRRQH
jgi:hypothetical protein